MVFHAPHYYIISKILSHHGKDVEDLYKFQVNLFHEMAYTMHVGMHTFSNINTQIHRTMNYTPQHFF